MILNALNELRYRNRITPDTYSIGCFILGDTEGRIDYSILAALVGIKSSTQDGAKFKVSRCVTALVATGLFGRQKRAGEWSIFTKQNHVSLQSELQSDLPSELLSINENAKSVNTGINTDNKAKVTEHLTEQIVEHTTEQVTNHHISDSSKEESLIRKEINKEKKKASDEISEAVSKIYDHLNTLRRGLIPSLKPSDGYSHIDRSGNISKSAVKLKNIVKGLSAQGLACFNYTDGRFTAKLSVSESTQLVCDVLEHVSRMRHTKEDPQYFNPETLFNGQFGKRLGWYLDSSRKQGLQFNTALDAMEAAFAKRRAEQGLINGNI